ncbi:MAG: UDP-glucose/GDP-mannose dehydrogenase family protein [Armatimonadota bacterium]|nr:UDP-glucose/GDP-mannose dehydrogenase family protein [bacterium]MDW8321849.1 UDP-glucose/GDP-mannose dehydrogenase family protein [Armatimonadota bacterium]
MQLSVIGTGYVGLVTGAVFADLGNEVICVDKDEQKVTALRAGIMPIYEPGLEEMVRHNVEEGRLSFTTDTEEAVRRSEVVFIAVGTPSLPDGQPDLSQVEDACRRIARALNAPKVIVNKSTVPVGTGDVVRRWIEQYAPPDHPDFEVVSNPEFLREGSAIYDTLHPDRIVIGAANQSAAMKLIELYAPLESPMIITDVNSAELIKYASNCFLAMKISYINAIARICDLSGADVTLVAKGMGYDKRIGEQFLQAGLGWGGSCFPKDVDAMIATADALGYDFQLLKAVRQINREQPLYFIRKMRDALGGLESKRIAILGLSFKPNTDDLREAKSLQIIAALLAEGAEVRAYDPIAMPKARAVFPQIAYCESAYDAASGCDAVAVVTEWNEFRQLDLERLRRSMRRPLLFDGRNIYNPQKVKQAGLEYYGIGRAASATPFIRAASQ